MEITKQYILHVSYDESGIGNPREWSNIGKIFFPGSKFKHYNESEFTDADDIVRNDSILFLPIYCLEHGNIKLSDEPFSCPWDSSLCGFIYAEKAEILEEGITLQNAITYFRNELKLFEQFLNGEVYHFRVDCIKSVVVEGEEFTKTVVEDSCSGLYSVEDIICNLPNVPINAFKGILVPEVTDAYHKQLKSKSELIK